MGNLGKLFGEADQQKVEEEVAAQRGLITAGIPAIESLRGTTAQFLAEFLSEGKSEQEAVLLAIFDETRVIVQDYLTADNFDMQDVGVRIAMTFVSLWELASDRSLTEESGLLSLVDTLVRGLILMMK